MSGSFGSYDAGASNGDDLYRDYVYAESGTFSKVLTNGDYELTLHLGNPLFAMDSVRVMLEGSEVEVVNTSQGQVVEKVYQVTVTDGQLDIRFVDQGGSTRWAAIRALDIVRLVHRSLR